MDIGRAAGEYQTALPRRLPAGSGYSYLIRPDNLSVLSPGGVRLRVIALTNLLRAKEFLAIIAPCRN